MRTRLVPVVVVGVWLMVACASPGDPQGAATAQEAPAEESTPAAEEEEPEAVIPPELVGTWEATVPDDAAGPFGRGRWTISIDFNDYNGILAALRTTSLRFTAAEKAQIKKTEKNGGVSGLKELGNRIDEQFEAEGNEISFPDGTIGCSAPASYAYSLKGKELAWKTVDEDRPCEYRTFLFEVTWHKVSSTP